MPIHATNNVCVSMHGRTTKLIKEDMRQLYIMAQILPMQIHLGDIQ